MQSTIGHYRLLSILGRGGMGEVHLAEDEKLGRKVALKILPEKMAADPERLRRFEKEAQVVAALSHPGIVTLHSLEEDAGVRFLTMEYVQGRTLEQILVEGKMSPERVGTVAAETAAALGSAHANGITHRDLKPANIMLTAEDRIKILDFGLAKLQEGSSVGGDSDALADTTTAAGSLLGTVAYMSPEQALGQPVDPRSDIFSLGIVLYELATGGHPFAATTPSERLASIIRDTAPSVAAAGVGLPIRLCRAIDRCLCKEPEQRFQVANDLSDALAGSRVRLNADTAARVQSVAVLPFNDLSAGRDQEHFCDGIAEELIDALTRLEGLRVASRTSALQFKGAPEDVRRIGELLSVESVVEGSLRTAGERLRVTVQFTSAADGYLVWSGKYDRTMDDVFGVQGEIAHRVVEALRVELAGGPIA